MRFFKRLAGFLGFVKDDGTNEARDQHHQDSEGQNQHQHQQARFRETGLPRQGFGVPVQVAVDRPHVGPVLVPCNSGDGGVQVCSVLVSSDRLEFVYAKLLLFSFLGVVDAFVLRIFGEFYVMREFGML